MAVYCFYLLKGETEEIGIVDGGAFLEVESLGGFAAVAGSEAKLGAVLVASPVEHGIPELAADALAADGLVGDEVFEIGDFSDDGSHNNA